MTKHLRSDLDFSKETILKVLAKAADLRKNGPNESDKKALAGKSVGMVFEKPSMRTRVSFEVGIHQLGGHAIYLHGSELGMGVREPVKDIARVGSRYTAAWVLRVKSQESIDEFAQYADVPVINALSDLYHPCQAVADMLTIRSYFPEGPVTVTYIGDANNVCRSLIHMASADPEISIRVCTPRDYAFEEALPDSVQVFTDPQAAAAGSDVLYTDVWTSMGQEEETARRLKDFEGFTIDEALFKQANEGAILLHCLPAHRGEEVSDGAFEAHAASVFDQAENRLYAQQAILLHCLSD